MPAIKMHPRPVRVRSTSPQGFWRAGRHFGPHWQEYQAGEFAVDQMAAIMAEPMLVVEEMAGLDPAAPGGDRTVAAEVVEPPIDFAPPERLSGPEEPPSDNPEDKARSGRKTGR